MKVVGLACALALGVNSINVREEQHEGTYSLANWQRYCVALNYGVCGFIDKDCCSYPVCEKGWFGAYSKCRSGTLVGDAELQRLVK